MNLETVKNRIEYDIEEITKNINNLEKTALYLNIGTIQKIVELEKLKAQQEILKQYLSYVKGQ